MIIEYAINPTHGDLGQAYIIPDDLHAGKPVIYLGGTLEIMNRIMKNDPSRITDERVLKAGSWERYYEARIEQLITHENIHIFIFDVTNSEETTRNFDNIDLPYDAVSGYGLEDSELDPKDEDREVK
jgi:hypothetical protein